MRVCVCVCVRVCVCVVCVCVLGDRRGGEVKLRELSRRKTLRFPSGPIHANYYYANYYYANEILAADWRRETKTNYAATICKQGC